MVDVRARPTAAATTLTEEQRRIVEWGDGPLVVIAGAGSGKTRVIVERVRHLLETQADLVPEQVLVLTYNVKAAKELGDRLEAEAINVTLPLQAPDGEWVSELSLMPPQLTRGMRVRHRSRGTGRIVTVKPTGKGAELLIRFDADGEVWMAFGLGILEFQA